MSIVVWFIIIIVVLSSLFVVASSRGSFKSYSFGSPNVNSLASQYTPSNPWGWNGDAVRGPNEKPPFEPPSVLVDGIDGACNVYTFTSTERFEPAVITFTSINSCNDGCHNGSCICSSASLTDTVCVDDDQIFAQKRKHVCQPNPTGWDIRTSGKCRTKNGDMVDPGTGEEFYVWCDPAPKPPDPNSNQFNDTLTPTDPKRCDGTLSLIAFRADIKKLGPDAFDGALCVSSPDVDLVPKVGDLEHIELSFESGIFFSGVECSMIPSYKGIPKQLFRVERASFDGRIFIKDPNGSFSRIYHRQTGFYIMPKLLNGPSGLPDITKPVFSDSSNRIPVELYSSKVVGSLYPWLLVPQLEDPANDKNSKTKRIIARSQIVYIPNARLLPSLNDKVKLWNYLVKTKSVRGLNMAGTIRNNVPVNILTTEGFVTVNILALLINPPLINPADENSRRSFAMLVDYSLASMITNNPQNFDFNGSFPD